MGRLNGSTINLYQFVSICCLKKRADFGPEASVYPIFAPFVSFCGCLNLFASCDFRVHSISVLVAMLLSHFWNCGLL